MAERDVNYTPRVVGTMPTKVFSTRGSALEDGVKYVLTQVEPGQAVIIADYATRVAAAAAMNGLRHRHGAPDASGLNFAVAKNESTGRTELFAVSDPSQITDEGKALHVKEYTVWRDAQREKTRKYIANKKAKESAGSSKAPTAKPSK